MSAFRSYKATACEPSEGAGPRIPRGGRGEGLEERKKKESFQAAKEQRQPVVPFASHRVTHPNPVHDESRLLSTHKFARWNRNPVRKERRQDECGQSVTHALTSEAARGWRRGGGDRRRGDRVLCCKTASASDSA